MLLSLLLDLVVLLLAGVCSMVQVLLLGLGILLLQLGTGRAVASMLLLHSCVAQLGLTLPLAISRTFEMCRNLLSNRFAKPQTPKPTDWTARAGATPMMWQLHNANVKLFTQIEGTKQELLAFCMAN